MVNLKFILPKKIHKLPVNIRMCVTSLTIKGKYESKSPLGLTSH